MQHEHPTQQENILTVKAKSVLMMTLMVAGSLMLMMDPAFAGFPGRDSPMGFVLCVIIDMVYGNLGRGLAILAVIIVGVGATLGKVSWGLAITVATGIATIFGAPNIVLMLTARPACVAQ